MGLSGGPADVPDEGELFGGRVGHADAVEVRPDPAEVRGGHHVLRRGVSPLRPGEGVMALGLEAGGGVVPCGLADLIHATLTGLADGAAVVPGLDLGHGGEEGRVGLGLGVEAKQEQGDDGEALVKGHTLGLLSLAACHP